MGNTIHCEHIAGRSVVVVSEGAEGRVWPLFDAVLIVLGRLLHMEITSLVGMWTLEVGKGENGKVKRLEQTIAGVWVL